MYALFAVPVDCRVIRSPSAEPPAPTVIPVAIEAPFLYTSTLPGLPGVI